MGTPGAATPNCRMGWELGSKDCTEGAFTPEGNLRVIDDTREAIWFITESLFTLESMLRMTRLDPAELVALMSVIPARVDTALSITWVICSSTTAGVAPV